MRLGQATRQLQLLGLVATSKETSWGACARDGVAPALWASTRTHDCCCRLPGLHASEA